jgi:hypothetical protein
MNLSGCDFKRIDLQESSVLEASELLRSLSQDGVAFFSLGNLSDSTEYARICLAIGQAFGKVALGLDGKPTMLLSINGSSITGSPVLSASRALIPHTDGALLNSPYDWALICNVDQSNFVGGESSLIPRERFLEIAQQAGKSIDELRELYLPYHLPKYSDYYCPTEPTWHPVVYGNDKNDPWICFAPDVLLESRLDASTSTFVSNMTTLLSEIQETNWYEIPIGCGYCLDNKRWLHGRRKLTVQSSIKEAVRSVIRIRGYF